MSSNHYEFGTGGDINNKFSYEVSIAIEGDETNAEGLITYNVNKNFELHFGIFDIPTGIDYYYLDAPVNKFITTTNITNIFYDGGWTEYGILAEYHSPNLNFKSFVVNSQFDKIAFGTNIEFYFYNKSFFEISYNKDSDSSGDNYIYNINTGVNLNYNDFVFITEFSKQKIQNIIPSDKVYENNKNGFYFTLIYNNLLKNITDKVLFAGIRYNSKIKEKNKIENIEEQYNHKSTISFLAGYEIKENSLIKIEYCSHNSDNILLMQIAVSF